MTIRPTSKTWTPREPSVSTASSGGAMTAAFEGDWTLNGADRMESLVGDLVGRGTPREIVLDLGGLGKLDTAGALIMNRLVTDRAVADASLRLVNVSDAHRILIEEVHQNDRPARPPTEKRNAIVVALEKLGMRGVGFVEESRDVLNVLGGASVHLARWIAWAPRFRFKTFVNHLDRTCLQAVPIIALMSLLIGGIIAQQGAFYFRRFGADLYVVDMVGVLTLREIGVLLTAVMVAGRSGSAFTAELGSMKMREEIDALRVIGLDPIEVLVLPRVLALVIAMPILTFVSDIAALLGALITAATYAGIAPETFMLRLGDAVTLQTMMVGLIKAPFMALIIGLIACVQGMQVKGSAESLGSQTTLAVVKSIFFVIVVDGIFAIFFASVGI